MAEILAFLTVVACLATGCSDSGELPSEEHVKFTLAMSDDNWEVSDFRMPKSGLVVRKSTGGCWRILRR